MEDFSPLAALEAASPKEVSRMKNPPRAPAAAAETASAPRIDADFLDAVREESAEFLASLGTLTLDPGDLSRLTLDEEDLRPLLLSEDEMRKIALDLGVSPQGDDPKRRTRR